ncbi:unnamed protein product [Mytilus edulis]|uniref:Integrase core domain-containing protein n=1 Tax=Mytilus edulis TaxID=6550 RepID=A0A8S3RUP5_MYTED|nr:unnamed protein product [Mytilus edulis]
MAQFDLSKRTFSELNDDDLSDVVLGETIQEFPLCGENMLQHMLIAKGIRVQRWRLRDSIQHQDILDPFNLQHLAALHFIYIGEINRRLQRWKTAWAGHRMRTVKSSPLILWSSGQLQNPVGIQLSETELLEYGLEGHIKSNNTEEGADQYLPQLAINKRTV